MYAALFRERSSGDGFLKATFLVFGVFCTLLFMLFLLHNLLFFLHNQMLSFKWRRPIRVFRGGDVGLAYRCLGCSTFHCVFMTQFRVRFWMLSRRVEVYLIKVLSHRSVDGSVLHCRKDPGDDSQEGGQAADLRPH